MLNSTFNSLKFKINEYKNDPDTIGTESQEIIQDNLDYTLFSWSKQRGIAPIAVKYGEGVYLYDYDGKALYRFFFGIDECKYWARQSTGDGCCSEANAGSELCNAELCNKVRGEVGKKLA
jgi:taurine--2-oxoglutarate transaminase